MNWILSPLPAIGALLYPPQQPPEQLLRSFAQELKKRGFRVGGVLQDTLPAEEGCKCQMVVEEIDTGKRLSLSQPLGAQSNSCVLDPQAMAEASGALRRALQNRYDLVLVNKFGKAEKSGRGFSAEMLALMAAKVPLLCPIPANFVQDWHEFTGGLGAILPLDETALWRWWGPEHLWQDLLQGVTAEPVLDIVWGQKFVMVIGPHGAGLAQLPQQGAGGIIPAADQIPKTLQALAQWVGDGDACRAALGMAAINAHYNRFDLDGPQGDGLTAVSARGHEVAVVGAFPGLDEKLGGPIILERTPTPGTIPEDLAPWAIANVDALVMTASTLINKSAAKYLRMAAHKEVVMVGPSTPLTPRLHSYGIQTLAGLVVQDVTKVAEAVKSGCGAKGLKPHCRSLLLSA